MGCRQRKQTRCKLDEVDTYAEVDLDGARQELAFELVLGHGRRDEAFGHFA